MTPPGQYDLLTTILLALLFPYVFEVGGEMYMFDAGSTAMRSVWYQFIDKAGGGDQIATRLHWKDPASRKG